jgi:hypothetical protein
MRKATRIAALSIGTLAGFAGLVHGYFEILQGNNRPISFIFPSMGPSCVPEIAWHACEPAMTILPNFLVTGVLTVILGLLVMIWSVGFIQRKNGGIVLIMLSVILLFVGSGFFPPLIGLIGGVAGTRINKPLMGKPGSITRFAARLWPWPLVILVAWSFIQYAVGYFFNDLFKRNIVFGLLLIVTMLPLSIYTAYAHDALN